MGLELTPDEVAKEIAFRPSNVIESFEMWKYPGQLDCTFQRARLSDDTDEIVTWLEKSHATSGGRDAEAGLKFLLVPASLTTLHRSPRDYNISQEALEGVLSVLGAPRFFFYSTLRARVYGTRFPNITTADGRTLFSYCLIYATRLGAMFWTFEPEACLSRGILLYLSNSIMLEIFQAGLAEQQSFLSSPHLLFISSITHILHKIDDVRTEERKALGNAEVTTGYHEYEPTNIKGRLAACDLGALSIKMSGSAGNLARTEMTIGMVEKLLKVIEDQGVTQNSLRGATDSTTRDVFHRVAFLSSYGDYQLADIKYLQRRVQIQLTAIFNLTAQRDQNLSILVAKDSRSLAISSKRDSTSMKTIAAVTMIFLPGTFVATLLSLPSFEWDPTQHVKVRRDFWIYWVITIPLTLLTLAIWSVWGYYTTVVELVAENEARDAVTADANWEDAVEPIPGLLSVK